MSGTDGINFDVVEEIHFKDSLFVLTGDFAFGNKKEIMEKITERGGSCSDGVSGKTNYVVVGSEGSAAWNRGKAGGKKVTKAMELKEKGKEVLIIKKEDLMKSLG